MKAIKKYDIDSQSLKNEKLFLVDKDGSENVYTMQDFLKLDMNGKILFNVLLPPLSDEYKLVTYKVKYKVFWLSKYNLNIILLILVVSFS